MLRLSVCSVMALAILVGGLLAADQNQTTNDKNNEANKAATADHAQKAHHGRRATITNVNPKEGTVTVRMKGKNGKEVNRTFHLTEDVRVIDDNTGKVAGLDVFRSGDEVLVVESKGHLQEMHRNPAHQNKGTEHNKGTETNKESNKSGRK